MISVNGSATASVFVQQWKAYHFGQNQEEDNICSQNNFLSPARNYKKKWERILLFGVTVNQERKPWVKLTGLPEWCYLIIKKSKTANCLVNDWLYYVPVSSQEHACEKCMWYVVRMNKHIHTVHVFELVTSGWDWMENIQEYSIQIVNVCDNAMAYWNDLRYFLTKI